MGASCVGGTGCQPVFHRQDACATEPGVEEEGKPRNGRRDILVPNGQEDGAVPAGMPLLPDEMMADRRDACRTEVTEEASVMSESIEMIGKIERVPLREVFEDEARDFTPWLRDNIDVLNDRIELTLSSPESEQVAGDFSVDILAEDEAGNPVIIENQLDKSDHDHLGKVITYLTAFEAKTAIWIVSDPRPEHVRAISWLNESSGGSFYLLRLEAIRVGESPPAALLTVIGRPSEEAKEVGKAKQELGERHMLRRKFWTQLLDAAKVNTDLHVNIAAGHQGWVGTGAGMSGLGLNYVVRQHDARVELYIDRGKDADGENKAIFDTLHEAKESIESSCGEHLVWERLDDKRACRISKVIELGGYRDDEGKWRDVHNAMIDAMIRLERALRPHIDALGI